MIPGVAIATALMPPLCTAGYGLANAQWSYFFGAIYLFAINSVFIAASAALVTRAYHVERKQFENPVVERRVRLMMMSAVLVTLLPSLYLAYRMVGEEIFRTRATQFVRDRLEFGTTHVSNLEIFPRGRSIEVSLIGDRITDSTLTDVVSRMPAAGLPDAKLRVFQAGDQQLDMTTLRSSLLGDLYRESQQQLTAKEELIEQLRARIESARVGNQRFEEVPAELNALFPQIARVLISEAREWNAGGSQSEASTLVVNLRVTRPLSREQRLQVESWLRARLRTMDVRLFVEPA